MRAQVVGGEQEQERFFEDKVNPYHEMVKLLIAQKQTAEALRYTERAKARVLLDVLQSGRVNVTKAMTEAERERERALNNELISLNTQIVRESQRSQPEQTHLADLKANLQKARLDYEAFRTSLYATHPELRVKRGEAQVVTLEETRALLPDAKSALLEFVVTEGKTYLFVLTHDGVLGSGLSVLGNGKSAPKPKTQNPKPVLKVYALDIKRDDLERRAQEFRQMLAVNDRRFRASARALHDLLLKPAQAQLQGKTTLCIVPDGGLWELPFQALQPQDGRYLIEDCALFYAPSLTALREMRKRSNGVMEYWSHGDKQHSTTPTLQHSTTPTLQHPNAPTLLAFGNPSLGKATVERVQLVHRDETLQPLPEAEAEVRTLGQLYSAAQSKVYVGASASETQAKSEAGQYQILHFATHGILNDRSPMYSHLLLAQSPPPTPPARGGGSANDAPLPLQEGLGEGAEDGLLEAWEIMNLDLKARLVVLSACQTARGRVGAGEGVIGLTWAVFVAGCPTTVVSQWKVPSRSTTELMLEFHKQLAGLRDGGLVNGKQRQPTNPPTHQLTKAEALRQAQLKLLKRQDDYRQPFHWAGFVVVGDGR